MIMHKTGNPAAAPDRPEALPRPARDAWLGRPRTEAPRPAGATRLPMLLQDFALSRPLSARARRWQVVRALAQEATAAGREGCGCGHDCANCKRAARDGEPHSSTSGAESRVQGSAD
jgi:hypothetical protein